MNKIRKERRKSKCEVFQTLAKTRRDLFIYLLLIHSIKPVGYRTCQENTYNNNKSGTCNGNSILLAASL